MVIHVLTLFPEVFPGALGCSMISKALQKGLATLKVHDLKQFGQQIDDKPCGGGAGMVMKAQPIDDAIVGLGLERAYKIFPSPRGFVFSQSVAKAMLNVPCELLFLCGRYEGVDQRVLDKWNFHHVSLGNFVLCGGEVAVMAMLEAMIRLIPGCLGNAESLIGESHEQVGQVGYSQYTQPANWQGRKVPEELLSGDHAKINAYRSVDGLLWKRKLMD